MKRGFNYTMKFAVRTVPFMDNAYKERLLPYVKKFKTANDEISMQNPFGVPITTGGWAGNSTVIDWAVTNYLLHKTYPEIIGPEYTCPGLNYIYGCHPVSNIPFVSGVGIRSKKIAYGNNRADFSFIADGIFPEVLILKPDFPENK